MKKHRGTFVFLFVGAKVSKGSIYTNRRGYALYGHYSVQQNYRSTSRSRNTTNLYLYVALELLDTSALTRTDGNYQHIVIGELHMYIEVVKII